MSAPAVSIVGVGKRYTKYEDQPLLVNMLRVRHRTRRSRLWALRGVSLDVARGECLGVIGRNGSGKTTLLKMLAGVTAPSEGRLTVRGRIAPLVSVGVGFHPELTGRENVYVNGIILGMTRREIDERFDAILDFSEIGDFIDTPVKFYSSGMFVRLGFAVAVHAEPDVLLVDEVLAVGDYAFQMKCFDRMMEIRESGTTVVVVSHNINAVRKMTDRTVVLHRGAMRFDGTTPDAVSLYHEMLGEERDFDDDDDIPDWTPGLVTIRDVSIHGPDGRETAHLTAGDTMTVRVRADFVEAIDDPMFGIVVFASGDRLVYGDQPLRHRMGRVEAGESVDCEIRLPVSLTTGSYTLRVNLRSRRLDATYARSGFLHFYVSGREMVGGVSDLNAAFRVERAGPDRRGVSALGR